MRAVAKEIRLEEQRKKAVEHEEARIARQAEKQLREDVRSSKKGKKKVLKDPAPCAAVSGDAEGVDTDSASVVDDNPAPTSSRRGRKITLPGRYHM